MSNRYYARCLTLAKQILNQISKIEINADPNDEIIIQIEVHVNDTFMGFKNNDVISWNELTEVLIPINRIPKNKLHLNIVACFGMRTGLSIDLKRTAPYKSYRAVLEKIKPTTIITDNNIV